MKTLREYINLIESIERGVAEYGDTARGQKMLSKVHHRAADRVTSKQADKDPAYARRAQQTQDRAWERMTDKDLEEGIIGSFLKNRVNAGTTPKEVAASAIRQLNQRAPGTKMEGHPNFPEFKQAVYDYVASAENSMEAIRRSSDDHVISLGKKYFKSGESDAALEENQEEDPIARIDRLFRDN